MNGPAPKWAQFEQHQAYASKLPVPTGAGFGMSVVLVESLPQRLELAAGFMKPLQPDPSKSNTLIHRARTGDPDAYNQLFAEAADGALAFIRLRLGPKLRTHLESQDILQEAWHAGWQAFPEEEQFDERGFTRWICRIVENQIRGLARHHRAKKRVPPGNAVTLSRVMEQARSASSPGTIAAKAERLQQLESALSDIDEGAREVLLLRFFQDRTIDEIASLTGRSATSVRRLLGQSAVTLGRLMGDGEPSK